MHTNTKQRIIKWTNFTAISTLMSVSLAACSNNGEPSTGLSAMKDTKEPVTLSMLYYDWNAPFNKDWPVFKELQAKTNVKLDMQIVPGTDYQNKAKIVLNSGKVPDIVTHVEQPIVLEYGGSGVLLPISDYMDKLPHLKNKIAEYKIEGELENWKSPDGKLYVVPFLTEMASYNRSPIVRTDIVEKYGLKVPTNTDELYEFLKKMKELNPNSFPLTGSNAKDLRTMFGAAWGLPANYKGFAHNKDSGKFEYVYTSENYKKYLTYLNRLMKEGLADPELFTSNEDQILKKVSTGKSMFYFFYNGQHISAMNVLGKQNTGPDFNVAMLPPIAGSAGQKAYESVRVQSGMVIPASAAKKPYFNQLLEFIDFLYSDEGEALLTWGIKGDTYDEKDGQKIFTEKLLKSDNVNRAFWDIGAANASLTMTWPYKWFAKIINNNDFEKYTEEGNRKNWFLETAKVPKLTSQQREEENLLYPSINDYFTKAEEQFVYGKVSINEGWDSYVRETNAKGVEKLLKTYNDSLK